MKTHILNVDQQDAIIQAEVGDALQLVLDESPTTGVLWQLQPLSFVGAIASDYYKTDSEVVPGASSTRFVHVLLNVKTNTDICLSRCQAWDPLTTKDKELSFSIIVN